MSVWTEMFPIMKNFILESKTKTILNFADKWHYTQEYKEKIIKT